MNDLSLRLDHPSVIDRERITGFGRQRQRMSAVVQFDPAIGMIVAVETGAHHDGIDVPAGGIDQCQYRP